MRSWDIEPVFFSHGLPACPRFCLILTNGNTSRGSFIAYPFKLLGLGFSSQPIVGLITASRVEFLGTRPTSAFRGRRPWQPISYFLLTPRHCCASVAASVLSRGRKVNLSHAVCALSHVCAAASHIVTRFLMLPRSSDELPRGLTHSFPLGN